MNTRWIIPGWILAGWFITCGVAQAQPAGPSTADADACRNTAGHPDIIIKHCTAALARDPKTSTANYYRGRAWSNQGEFDRAIADFDAAIALRPDDPVLYHARGIEFTVKGDNARAIADFDKALRLDPKAHGVHFARGRALFYQSDFARAATDIDAAFKTQPNLYTALWLYLARKRGGDPDADALLERETRRLRGGWPASVIALYMGRTDARSVTVSATTADPVRHREMRCEADFYIAHAHLIKGERPPALALLQGVQRDCPKNLLEYEGTLAELRRLK